MLTATVEKYRDYDSKGEGREERRLARRDALPSKGKMTIGSYRRTYTANWSQLRRWLGNQVGRPWNKVHSEMVALAPKNTLERHHLDTSIGNMVELNVREEDGVLYTNDGFRSWPLRGGDLYVLNGVLCRIPVAPKVKPARKLVVTFTGQMEAVGIYAGQWFVVTFAGYTPRATVTVADAGRYDVYLKDTVNLTKCNLAYGKAVYAVAKRAMSKAEIRRFRNGQ